jgi:hypothetical protein
MLNLPLPLLLLFLPVSMLLRVLLLTPTLTFLLVHLQRPQARQEGMQQVDARP